MSNTLFFHTPLPEKDLKKRRKMREDEESDFRTSYFRDATAIIHSYPFRRLKHKTQVFFSPKSDHICTRIEHVLHVSSIAAVVCRALDLNSDLAWAIGLGHDLGHAPFGHVGERILSKLSRQRFEHEANSLRVVDHLANRGNGLNLTYAVRDGIVNHCGERFEQSIKPDFSIKKKLDALKGRQTYPATWEGCVMRMADKMAYLGRDLEDAISLQIVKISQLPEEAVRVLGNTNSKIIDVLTGDMIKTSQNTGAIGFSDDVYAAFDQLRHFNYQHIYMNPVLTHWHEQLSRVLGTLYGYLMELFAKHGEDSEAYQHEDSTLAEQFGRYLASMLRFYQDIEGSFEQAPLDYIAGMTDDYAVASVKDMLIPQRFDANLSFKGFKGL